MVNRPNPERLAILALPFEYAAGHFVLLQPVPEFRMGWRNEIAAGPERFDIPANELSYRIAGYGRIIFIGAENGAVHGKFYISQGRVHSFEHVLLVEFAGSENGVHCRVRLCPNGGLNFKLNIAWSV